MRNVGKGMKREDGHVNMLEHRRKVEREVLNMKDKIYVVVIDI